jgi:hypothetical protein
MRTIVVSGAAVGGNGAVVKLYGMPGLYMWVEWTSTRALVILCASLGRSYLLCGRYLRVI